MSTQPTLQFDEWLRDELDRRGWRQEDLAELIGVDQSTVSGWASGKSRPQPSNCDAIARVFGVPRNLVRGHADRPLVRDDASTSVLIGRQPIRKPSDPLFQRAMAWGLTASDEEIEWVLERAREQDESSAE